MAKQIEDNRTAELPLPAAPKRPGRPSTGKAMTAAERKRKQRIRDKAAVEQSAKIRALELNERHSRQQYLRAYTDQDLMDMMGAYMARGEYDQAQMYWAEMGTRKGWRL